MHIDKHRAISYCAFKRCYDLIPELQKNTEYHKIFYPLWMGNWLTDISQASAFFSFLPDWGFDPVSGNTDLDPLKPTRSRWLEKCFVHQGMERAYRAKEDQQTDYYQNRKNGSYVLPAIFHSHQNFKKGWENFIGALWNDEWESAKGAWRYSQDMGELQEFPSLKAPDPPVTPGKAEEIGTYYPLDHFDVTDQYIIKEKKKIVDNREGVEFTEYKNRDYMTATVHESLKYAKKDWLKKAFDTTLGEDKKTTQKNRITNYQALKFLGHALHTLQDFYAHSNYSDLLLICMAEEGLLEGYWNKRIYHLAHHTDVGTFNSFVLSKENLNDAQGKGRETPVVTGRFDPIDTIHTLIHLAIENIHGQDEEKFNKKQKEDRLYKILFGTFSDIDVVQKVKKPFETYRYFSRQIDLVQAGISRFFMNYLIDPAIKKILKEQEHLINAYLLLKDATLDSEEDIWEYRKAGELLFHQHSIENYLRKKIKEAEQNHNLVLPHHALLAKDHDKTNDAVKLSYKLSCALAAEATTEVLVKYFQGGTFSELEPLLKRRYVHPKFHIKKCAETGSLNNAIEELDKKWFWHASKTPENGQSILGFEMSK